MQGLTTAFDPLSSVNKEDSGDLLQVAEKIYTSVKPPYTTVFHMSHLPPPGCHKSREHSSSTLRQAGWRKVSLNKSTSTGKPASPSSLLQLGHRGRGRAETTPGAASGSREGAGGCEHGPGKGCPASPAQTWRPGWGSSQTWGGWFQDLQPLQWHRACGVIMCT